MYGRVAASRLLLREKGSGRMSMHAGPLLQEPCSVLVGLCPIGFSQVSLSFSKTSGLFSPCSLLQTSALAFFFFLPDLWFGGAPWRLAGECPALYCASRMWRRRPLNTRLLLTSSVCSVLHAGSFILFCSTRRRPARCQYQASWAHPSPHRTIPS